ncbi:NAD-dependent epimerase/dehydratase family protein [Pseudonocardia oceani]|uniref:NAD-dependent epimerase/dehydratase family protein n=1 Tax=Pseudonocardia oceani TaxID=2792013 RepID=UPI001C49D1E5|nr:NAD-dependent epimerase/dehydratase family protein [Pseudonocardia oceani]
MAPPTAPGRLVVTGASGNVGTGVLRALADRLPDTHVVGVCRRPPRLVPPYDRVEWHVVDLGGPDAADALEPAVRGADAVVHLAWAIQPVRAEQELRRTNVGGTRAVLRAATAAGVDRIVYASSLGVYAPGATEPVDERWPDSGQRTSAYSRHKVEVERLLDQYERENPGVAVARIRPTLVVQRAAATEVRSLFLGPLVTRPVLGLLRDRRLPVVPVPPGLALQFVHADDVGDAVVRILQRRASGAYNIAADALEADALAGVLGARAVPVPRSAVRAVVAGLYTARAVPVSPGWFDVALNTPVMDTTRARTDLDWTPSRSSVEGARELLDGLAEGAVGASPALGGPGSAG